MLNKNKFSIGYKKKATKLYKPCDVNNNRTLLSGRNYKTLFMSDAI
jgi:hypothetical protein